MLAGAVILFLLLSALSMFYFRPSWFVNFYVSEGNESIRAKIAPFYFSVNIANTSSGPENIQWSLDKKHVAFFNLDPDWANNSDELSLNVIDARTFRVKTIFIGDYRTSHYRWINNSIIRVYVDAGTDVRIYRDLSINSNMPFSALSHASPEYWTPQAWYDYDD